MRTEYIPNDVRAASYTYNPKLNNWSSVIHRSNNTKRVATVFRVRIKKNKIKVLAQYWEGPAHSKHDDDLNLVQTIKLEFRDKEFANKLKDLRS